MSEKENFECKCSNPACGRTILHEENLFMWFGDIFCWDCYVGYGCEILKCVPPATTP